MACRLQSGCTTGNAKVLQELPVPHHRSATREGDVPLNLDDHPSAAAAKDNNNDNAAEDNVLLGGDEGGEEDNEENVVVTAHSHSQSPMPCNEAEMDSRRKQEMSFLFFANGLNIVLQNLYIGFHFRSVFKDCVQLAENNRVP